MGTIVMPFAIDMEKVKSVFGSKNKTLHQQILQSRIFEKYDEKYSFKKELKDVIFNYVPENERIVLAPKLFGLIKGNDGSGMEGEWNDYGYALLCICGNIGKCLSENEGTLKYNGTIERLNELLKQNESGLNFERVVTYRKLFDTPYEEEDICSNYFDKNEIKEMLAELVIAKSKADQGDVELVRLIDRMERGFKYCIKYDCEWVSFSYDV
ncbi:MAG TPA: hypothetical protein VGF30_10540 [Bacteroidia bacterium]